MTYTIISTEKISGIQNTLYSIEVPIGENILIAEVYLPDNSTQSYIDDFIDNYWLPLQSTSTTDTESKDDIDIAIELLASVGIGTTTTLDEDII